MRGSAYFRHVGYSELAIAIGMPSICFRFESDEFKLELLFFFQSSGHREELQCHVEEDTAEERVMKIEKILLAEVFPYRVIDRGKSKLRMETACAHVQVERHPEFHLDCAYTGRATEDRVVDVRILEGSVVDRTR